MKILVGWTLLAVAIAEPYDVLPLSFTTERAIVVPKEERRHLQDVAGQIRKSFEEEGYPDEAVVDYLDIVDIEKTNLKSEDNEKKITRMHDWAIKWSAWMDANKRLKGLKTAGYPDTAIQEYSAIMASAGNKDRKMAEWSVKWQPVLIENQQREGMLAAGYPNNAVEELLRLQDFAHPERITNEKVAKINAWHTKWDVVMMENVHRKDFKELGYPDVAIDQYLAIIDMAHPGEMTDEKSVLVDNWHQHWDPVMQDHQLRLTYRSVGYPDAAIDEFLILNRRVNPDEKPEEKAERYNAWQAKWAPAMQQNQMRNALRGQGYSDEAIKERALLDLDNANSTDTVGKAARTAKWERKWTPVREEEPIARSPMDEKSKQIVYKAVKSLEGLGRVAGVMSHMANEAVFTQRTMNDIMNFVQKLPLVEREAVMDVMRSAATEVHSRRESNKK